MNAEFSHLLQLGRAEKLLLVEDLWDSLASESAEIPVADWKREELQRRRESFLKNPSSGRSWEQVKARAAQ